MTVTIAGKLSGAAVGSSGYTNAFTSLPAAGDWSTLSVAGGAGDIVTVAALNTAVAAISANTVTNLLGSVTGNPAAASGPAVWNSSGHLQTRPTGNAYTLLMATYVNNTGSTVSNLTISYDFTTNAPTAEEIAGHLVYFSSLGATGSWVNIPALSSGAGGRVSTNLNVSWSSGITLYLLWADDNGSGSPDTALQIDNFSLVAAAGTTETVSLAITTPTNNQAFVLGAAFPINTTVSGSISNIAYYLDGVLLGTDSVAPFNLICSNAAMGSHVLTAIANNTIASPPVALRVISLVTNLSPNTPFLFRKVFESGTIIAGASNRVFLQGLQLPVISHGNVLFGGNGSFGIPNVLYLATPSGFIQVAGTNTPTPPANTNTFSGFGPAALSGSNIVFSASDGLYFWSEGVITRIAPGTFVPPEGGITVDIHAGNQYFAIDGTSVVFQAGGFSFNNVYRWQNGIITKLAPQPPPISPNIPYLSRVFPDSVLDYEGGVLAVQGDRGTGFFGIHLLSGGQLTTVADFGDVAPGGGNFGSLNHPRISKGNVTFFGRGSLTNGTLTDGIYLRSNNSLSIVADQRTVAPGRTNTFSRFFGLAIDGAEVAFSASIESPLTNGLYRTLSGALVRLIGPGDTLDGRIVSDVEFSYKGFSDGEIAFVANFEDFSRAIYVATPGIPAGPSVSISDVLIAEGNAVTNAVFALSLSSPSSQTVTVDFATANGAAIAGTDFVATSGTVTFPAGTTNQTISIVIQPAITNEVTETFFVRLSNPNNVTIADGEGAATILAPPTITLQPQSQVSGFGSTVVFTANAVGSAPLSYQWQLNATNVPGATNATLTVSNANAINAGNYAVRISNAAGTVTSTFATLSLLDLKMYAGLTIVGPVGNRYQLQFANQIDTNAWLALTNISLPFSPYLFIDVDSPNWPKRFYRAIPLP